ncbi:MAG: hypothetical protein ACTSVM_06925 [Candidatus Ranarchaeia archaeon]
MFYRKVVLETDWILRILFIVIFIDFHVISTISLVSESVIALNLQSTGNVFLLSVVCSQLISNVPASVLVAKFSHEWLPICYGVNAGGNGLVIGSLANIIALRMMNRKKIWLVFHKYSIPYFLLTIAAVYLVFYVLQ